MWIPILVSLLILVVSSIYMLFNREEGEEKEIKPGPFIGGLANDGNTCFINSIIQSLASSTAFTDFLNQHDKTFIKTLNKLLSELNVYREKSKLFSTKPLLKVMNDSPSRHLFFGYNQEDAQEFYQNLMKQIESEVKEKDEKEEEDEKERKKTPLNLVTPVDGIQTEEIKCTNCGESSGKRNTVVSGLSLSIPKGTRHTFDLNELLDEFVKPELIDGVECNRCTLTYVKDSLESNLQNIDNEKLSLKIRERIDEISKVLRETTIPDDVFQKFSTTNMVKHVTKAKSTFISKPPPLLCIHINRSVYDPARGMVRKNSSKINFPIKLDLSEYMAPDSNEDSSYTLKSVVSHWGTHNYGHYTCHRWHNDNWYAISDDEVSLCTEENVLKSDGTYMLFYELANKSILHPNL